MIDCSLTLRIRHTDVDNIQFTTTLEVDHKVELYTINVYIVENLFKSQFDMMWNHVTDTMYHQLKATIGGQK